VYQIKKFGHNDLKCVKYLVTYNEVQKHNVDFSLYPMYFDVYNVKWHMYRLK